MGFECLCFERRFVTDRVERLFERFHVCSTSNRNQMAVSMAYLQVVCSVASEGVFFLFEDLKCSMVILWGFFDRRQRGAHQRASPSTSITEPHLGGR